VSADHDLAHSEGRHERAAIMRELEAGFAALLKRARSGCNDSARQLYELYGGHVLRVVRRKLHRRLRTQYDSADLHQAVWASFFAISTERRDFASPNDLIDYLCAIAANKTAEVFRKRMQTDQFNLNREKSLEVVAHLVAPASEQPTPSQACVADEYWERLLEEQPPLLRKMLELLRAGFSYQEIGEQTGLHPKAIQRHLRRLTKGSDS
jgi:RNA polymerase sigma factor (sigma-70 family)